MKTILTNLYQYSELSVRAKEKAREWYRAGVFTDSSDWDSVIEDADQIAALLGIEIDRRSYQTYGGKTRTEPAIYFSLGYGQSDYAGFEGLYSYRKGALKALKAEIGNESDGDKKLLRIASALQELQRRNFYSITGVITCRKDYTRTEVECEKGNQADAEAVLPELMRDFAKWIYRQLQAEYEHQTSDEVMVENIEANGYEFHEDGTPA